MLFKLAGVRLDACLPVFSLVVWLLPLVWVLSVLQVVISLVTIVHDIQVSSTSWVPS